MRNHALKWSEIPDWHQAEIRSDGLNVSSVPIIEQYVVSGNLAAFGRDSGLDPTGVGALGLATGTAYTVRLARDRLMTVGAGPGMAMPGWNDGGYAVTCMTAALHVFEISGANALAVIQRATTLDPAKPGPCAVVTFAGISASLYRHGRSDRYRLHVDRGLAVYVWSWLDAAVAAMVTPEG